MILFLLTQGRGHKLSKGVTDLNMSPEINQNQHALYWTEKTERGIEIYTHTQAHKCTILGKIYS